MNIKYKTITITFLYIKFKCKKKYIITDVSSVARVIIKKGKYGDIFFYTPIESNLVTLL